MKTGMVKGQAFEEFMQEQLDVGVAATDDTAARDQMCVLQFGLPCVREMPSK